MPAAWREHFDNIFVLVIKLRSNRPTNRKSLFKKGYKVHFDLMVKTFFRCLEHYLTTGHKITKTLD